jgi:hypothetical protein
MSRRVRGGGVSTKIRPYLTLCERTCQRDFVYLLAPPIEHAGKGFQNPGY